MIVVHVEFVSFHEHGADISWIKGGPGVQAGGTPLASLAFTCHLEESASHHFNRSRALGETAW